MAKKSICPYKNFFENKAWDQGLLACGIDEVGRGCLAGPVTVAAVVLPHCATYDLLRDSKVMTAGQRDIAYDWIVSNCFYAVATVSPQIVDAINIYQSTLCAMQRAYMHLVAALPCPLETIKYVVVDAMPLSINSAYGHRELEVHFFEKGESLSTSIAAASIVAKVTRDRLLQRIDQQFPLYALAGHKGYATQEHTDALRQHGAAIIHRQTFLKTLDSKQCDGQQKLF